MPLAGNSPPVTFVSATPRDVDADLLFVPVFEGENIGSAIPDLVGPAAVEVQRAAATREIQGRSYELFVTPVSPLFRANRLALIGAGKPEDLGTERLSRVAVAAGLAAKQRRTSRVAFFHRGPIDTATAVQTITEGLLLSSFNADFYKSADRAPQAPDRFLVAAAPGSSDTAALEGAAARGAILGEATNLARHLGNEPSNVLTPSAFADRAHEIVSGTGLALDVLDERQIAHLRMGLLLGVARGSAEPPRVIVLRHEPRDAPAAPVLGLVGKGITFDTGGISIKPADGMERMKDDMAGGAAVISAMRAVALLRAPIRVIGVVPTTENMPGGRAIKPGDVLTGASGRTIEVINTDAEGRLILGDGLWYAQQLGATHLVDVATLTGACVVALGRAASGLFGQPEWWTEVVRRAALRAGESVWPMPLFDDYSDQLRSEIADSLNTGGRPAGACTAAMFLREFTGGLPWAHLDIAGTAWAEDAKPWLSKGATGVAVRTLAELAFTSAEWR